MGLLLRSSALVLLTLLVTTTVHGQRERTRPNWNPSTRVNEAQAGELTLTLTETAIRPVQVWVRAAGTIDVNRRLITAVVSRSDGARLRVGQRARAFSPESRSRMYQANVSQVTLRGDGVAIAATVMGQPFDASRHFILEIVTENDEVLSVPNEAIIESGGRQIVYIQQADGSYAQREIKIGLRGELFTQVLEGLEPGQQVVSIGSFFIDAEHRLKGS